MSVDHDTVFKALKELTESDNPLNYYKVFGSRFNDAWKIVKEKRVFKVIPENKIIYWIVRGEKGDYLIYPSSCYCSCDDFYFNVVNGRAKACKHLITQKLAEILFKYKTLRLNQMKNRELYSSLKKSISGGYRFRSSILLDM